MKINTLRTRTLLILFLTHAYILLVGQSKIDSLYQVIAHSTNEQELSKACSDIAIYYHGNNRDSAVKYINLAWDYAEYSNDPIWKANLAMTSAEIQQHDLSIDTLVEIGEHQLKIAKKSNDTSLIVSTLISIGSFYSNKGIPLEGMSYLIEGKDLAIASQDFVGAGKLQYNMGSIYYNSGMIEYSAKYFEHAINYFEKGKHLPFKTVALSSLGNILNETNRPDSAIIIGKSVIEMADSMKYSKGQIDGRSLLFAAYESKKEYEKAFLYAKEANALSEKYGSKFSQANCQNNMGKAFYNLGDYRNAITYLEKAHSSLVMKNNSYGKHFISKPLARSHQKLGHFEKASQLYYEYIEYQDSVINKENKSLIAELELKYEDSKKELQLKVQENTILTNAKQKNTLIFLIITIASFAIGIITFLLYKKKKSEFVQQKEVELKEKQIENLLKEKEISSLTAMITGQENERKRIAQDLHDGLGGLLASVKTRIGFIEEEINELKQHDLYGQTNSLIDKACSEVRRISQNLMPTSLRLYGLTDALEQLIHEKESSYGMLIEYEIMGDRELRYMESKEVFVYRIVQEAMNNAIKHSEASKILVQLSTYVDHINVVIEDNGKGFDPGLETKGIGLHSIRSRVEYMKGNIDIRSEENDGTCITIDIPITS